MRIALRFVRTFDGPIVGNPDRRPGAVFARGRSRGGAETAEKAAGSRDSDASAPRLPPANPALWSAASHRRFDIVPVAAGHPREPLPFTAFHRHELRNGLRLRVFRKEITVAERQAAFAEIDSDLKEEILAYTPIPWTDTFRQAEDLAAAHTETLGVRSFDLLHVGLALVIGATRFLTFDPRQAALAKAAGLEMKRR